MYSVSWCGPGGCFAPGTYRPNSRWDRQIEADAAAGKLDFLADEAPAEHRAGKTRLLCA
jgi:hypothetical protein